MDLEGALGWVPASLLRPKDGGEEEVIMERFAEEEGQHKNEAK